MKRGLLVMGLLVVGVAVAVVLAIATSTPAAKSPPPSSPTASSAAAPPAAPVEALKYPWLEKYDPAATLLARIAPPAGFARTAAAAGSYEDWLRRLPLKTPGAAVHLFDGRPSANQEAHAVVIDIDIGAKDLMQCADTVIRLRAEYLHSVRQFEAIHFNFTSGDRADFTKWAEGYRPVVKGSAVTWVKGEPSGTGHASLRAYLDVVFTYAGTMSLAKELRAVDRMGATDRLEDPRIGDVYITPGSPGHVVVVVDLAANPSGKKMFLLAQGFMPAQEPHILKNPASPTGDPWYAADFGDTFRTPQWVFKKEDLKRF
jgi:hypothetical protein